MPAGFKFLQCAAFKLIEVGIDIFYAVPFVDEFGCAFFSDAFDAGDIIYGIAHQGQDIDDLFGAFNAIIFTYLFWSPDFRTIALLGRLIDKDVIGHQLAEVFIRRDHIYIVALLFGAFG